MKTSNAPASTTPTKHDAIVVLKNDHAEVKKLFKEYERLANKEDIAGKTAVANRICAELTVHTKIEEEIFYPAAREAIEDDDLLNEADVEHASAKDLITQIQSGDPSDPMYDAKVKVLSEYIEHHVEEEETEMFPKVREAKKLDLKAMGQELTDKKGAMLQALTSKGGEIDPAKLASLLDSDTQH
ncbi:hemerythrin domain-containing protein [Methylobacillus glycogenes]|uniref:hemerythrin domain-containing protein n=1 Tax=Methylobacillus glycogenes TaxID=406 RepID=UPI0004716006|nr:hemerythrin domain-containing protein [Methylobacillus glycogenes]